MLLPPPNLRGKHSQDYSQVPADKAYAQRLNLCPVCPFYLLAYVQGI